MHWLAKVFSNFSLFFGLYITCWQFEQQPSWGRSREFEITTRTVNRSGVQSTGDLDEDEEDDDECLTQGRTKRTVAFMPSIGEQ